MYHICIVCMYNMHKYEICYNGQSIQNIHHTEFNMSNNSKS